jgi:hypothetical protein
VSKTGLEGECVSFEELSKAYRFMKDIERHCNCTADEIIFGMKFLKGISDAADDLSRRARSKTHEVYPPYRARSSRLGY